MTDSIDYDTGILSTARPDGRIGRALYVTLLAAMVGPTLTFVILGPSLPLIASHFGGGAHGQSIAQMGQELSFLGGTLGGLFAGTMISRAGLNRMLKVAALACGAGAALAMTISAVQVLLLGCFAVGAGGAFLLIGLTTATSAVLRGDARTRMIGFQAATSDIASVVLGLGAGTLAQIVGWRGPFSIYLVFGLAMFLLVVISHPRANERSDGGELAGMLTALRLAWPIYLCAILVAMLIAVQQIQLPFILAGHGLSNVGSRLIVQTGSAIASTVFSLSFGFSRAWLGERRLLGLGGIFGAIGFTGFAIWDGGLLAAVGAAAAIGAGVGISVPLLFTVVLRNTPRTLHGYSIGVLNTALFLGGAVNPVLFNPIIAHASITIMLVVGAMLALAGAGGGAFLMRGGGSRVEHLP